MGSVIFIYQVWLQLLVVPGVYFRRAYTLHFPVSLAVRSGHVISLWPMACEQKSREQFPGHDLKEKVCAPCLLFLTP